MGRPAARACKKLGLACALGVSISVPARDASPVTITLDPKLALTATQQKTLEAELQTILSRIGRPEDPPLKIELTPAYLKHGIDTRVDATEATLRIDVGYLAFVRNESEMAGVLATELSKLAWRYEEAAAAAKLTGDERGQEFAARKAALERAEGGPFRDQLKRAGVEMDFSGETRRNLEAALKSVDRLIQGGYDPWGLIDPRKRVVRLERGQSYSQKFRQWVFQRNRKSGESIDTEFEVLRNYLLYLETKRVDITQLAHRRAPLPATLGNLQLRALGMQSAMLGPAAREVVGLGGNLSLGILALSAGPEVSAQLNKQLLTFGKGPESTAPAKEIQTGSIDNGAMTPVPDAVKQAQRKVVGHALEAVSYPLLAWSLNNIWETLDDQVAGGYRRRYLELLKSQSAVLGRQLRAQTRLPETPEILDLARELETANLFIDNFFSYSNRGAAAGSLFGEAYGPVKTRSTLGLSTKNYYLERALKELELTAPLESKDERRVKARAREIAYEELIRNPTADTLWPHNANWKDAEDSGRAALRIFSETQLLPWLASQLNTELFLNLAQRKLAQVYLSNSQRNDLREALLRITALDHASPRVTARYLDLFREHFPQDYDTGHQQLRASIDLTGPESGLHLKPLTRSFLRQHGRSPLSDEELLLTFRELVDAKLLHDATQLLVKNFERMLRINDRAGPAEREAFFTAIGALVQGWDRLPDGILLRNALKAELFAKMLTLKDAKVRHAFASRTMPLFAPSKGREPSLTERALDIFVTRYLDGLQGEDLFDAAADLRDRRSAEPKQLARFLADRIELAPEMLDEHGIARVLNDDLFWIKSGTQNNQELSDLERKILDRYAEEALRYDVYTYHPGHSERLQRSLLSAYRKLGTEHTPEADFEFWHGLASRGPTGPTDQFFAELWQKQNDPAVRRVWAQAVIEGGLVWDEGFRGQLYTEARTERLGSETLELAAEEHAAYLKSLENNLLQTMRLPPGETRELELRPVATRFLTAVRGSGNGTEPVARAAANLVRRLPRLNEAQTTDALAELHRDYAADFRRNARRDLVERQLRDIASVFPNGGQGFIAAAEGLSRTLQTERAEALLLKDKILNATQSQEKEFGYALVNELVQEAVDWPKADKWALVRWLRGTGPVPNRIAPKLRQVGADTVRRLYATLPIFARQAFMSALLASPGKGVLEGIERGLYYEQVLNEILPRDEKSAQIANDVLAALLKSVAKVSHPEKKNAVLAYLLANHGEKGNAGSVLRNALEAYGVPGVKMAQLLAASDVLPEAIRRELAQARDQAKEPYRHEIHDRLGEATGRTDYEKFFNVGDLIGAASVKYAVKVKEPNGRDHVIQIKREEADVAIARDFEQLDIMIDELIRKNSGRYAFLKGMIEATKSAIWRELSLRRESQKSEIAAEQYDAIRLKNGLTIEVPHTSNLIERIGGPNSRYFYLRSADFAAGSGFDVLPDDVKPRFAEAVLEAEHEILFPKDNRATFMDADRHPGNARNDARDADHLVLRPIDFGQLIEVQPHERERTLRLMSYAQLLELVGPTPSLVEKIQKEFLPKVSERRLAALLRAYYPNSAKTPRSSLGPYYYLLASLEKLGFDRSLVHYDFIKAIYQLEPYEAVLKQKGSTHASPKATFAKRVEEMAKAIAGDLHPGALEKIRYAVTHPQGAAVAAANLKHRAALENGATPPPAIEKTSPAPTTQRRQLESPPEAPHPLKGVRDIYLAEFINATFWSLYEKNPTLAHEWIRNFFTYQKHLEFASFSVSAEVVRSLANRALPMSQAGLRYISEHGVSMAVGMQVAEVTRRLLAGQSVREAVQEALSAPHLAEVGFSTAAFMAVGATLDKVETNLRGGVPKPREIGCKELWHHIFAHSLLKTSATFIGAEAIERTVGDEARRRGWLPEAAERTLLRLQKKYSARIRAHLAATQKAIDDGDTFSAYRRLGRFTIQLDVDGNTWTVISLRDPQETETLESVIREYQEEIISVEQLAWDTKTVRVFEEERDRLNSWLREIQKSVPHGQTGQDVVDFMDRLKREGFQLGENKIPARLLKERIWR